MSTRFLGGHDPYDASPSRTTTDHWILLPQPQKKLQYSHYLLMWSWNLQISFSSNRAFYEIELPTDDDDYEEITNNNCHHDYVLLPEFDRYAKFELNRLGEIGL